VEDVSRMKQLYIHALMECAKGSQAQASSLHETLFLSSIPCLMLTVKLCLIVWLNSVARKKKIFHLVAVRLCLLWPGT
jgi:hypothetical protein